MATLRDCIKTMDPLGIGIGGKMKRGTKSIVRNSLILCGVDYNLRFQKTNKAMEEWTL
jgi:hypothetical protein